VTGLWRKSDTAARSSAWRGRGRSRRSAARHDRAGSAGRQSARPVPADDQDGQPDVRPHVERVPPPRRPGGGPGSCHRIYGSDGSVTRAAAYVASQVATAAAP